MKRLTGPIDPSWIEKARKAGACDEALSWLEEEGQRTWEELKEECPEWYEWAYFHIPDFPLDLTGLSSTDKAWIIAKIHDRQFDLKDLDPENRAWIMATRHDYPIDLTDFTSELKEYVMINRKDCPVSYEGLTVDQAWWVHHKRTHNGWDCPPLPDWVK